MRASAAVPERSLGVVPLGDGRSRVLVWAPLARRVAITIGSRGERAEEPVPLEPLGAGYHGTTVGGCGPGTCYHFVLDDGPGRPDPASLSQPDGVGGPSEVFDTGAHPWSDAGFVAPPLWRYVLYELHIGTFTGEGTFDAAVGALDDLVDLGVTAVELMPVGQFPGRHNWGYDGVFPFVAQSSYGGPAGLQRLVDACHQRSLAVVLDVVYNHLGPEGNVLGTYGPYATDRYRTPWGPAINVDGPGSDHVRRYFIENALSWLRDFHVDALRLDAVHGIVDPTATPFLTELARAVAEYGELCGRQLNLIAESADNDPRTVTPEAAGGIGLDAQWNDDFHHALHAVVTGERLGYYGDFGDPGQIARAAAAGFVYQGEHSAYRKRRHGASSSAIDPHRLVVYGQNHDQVGNRPRGDRLASTLSPPQLRAVAAMVLLTPGTPLLFMGEEYGETAPFPYFVDPDDPELARAIGTGRREELASYGWSEEPLDPLDRATYQAAVLDRSLASQGWHSELRALYRRLLALRRTCAALTRSARQDATAHGEGNVVVVTRSSRSITVRIACNLASEPASVHVGTASPGPAGGSGHEPVADRWTLLIDSSDPALGGAGARQPDELTGGLVRLDGWAFCAYQTTAGEGRS